MYGICIYMCVCDINYVYTVSEVLNNFISLATQKMTFAHLKENKKMRGSISTI